MTLEQQVHNKGALGLQVDSDLTPGESVSNIKDFINSMGYYTGVYDYLDINYVRLLKSDKS